jgi:hypothetical protein
MSLTDTTAIARLLPEVETQIAALATKIETALASADLSNVKVFLDALVAELAALANPDPSTSAKLKANVKTVLGKVGHLFGAVARDVADVVDPTAPQTQTVTATASPSVASPMQVPPQP